MKSVSKSEIKHRKVKSDCEERWGKVERFEIQDGFVRMNGEEIPIIWRGEVLVIGGGTAGVTAAAASARKKIPVMVVEKNSWFGGEMACGGGAPAEGAFPGGKSIGGLMDELLAGLRFAGKESAHVVQEPKKGIVYYFDNEYYKKLADEYLWKSGCGQLLNTVVTDILHRNKKVCGVIVNSGMKKAALLANAVIDSTADALAARALGIPLWKENTEPTYRYPYILQNVDVEKLAAYQKKDLKFASAREKAAEMGMDVGEDGQIWKLQGGIGDGMVYADSICLSGIQEEFQGTDTRVQLKAHRKMYEHIQFYRSLIPGMEECRLFRCASHVIAHGTPRIEGFCQMRETEARKQKKREDGILRCRDGKTWYELPYGVMVTELYENLLVAGKAVSVDPDIQRNLGMASRMAMGQCAGIAAAMVALKGVRAVEISGALMRSMMEEVGCDIEGDKTRVFSEMETLPETEG